MCLIVHKNNLKTETAKANIPCYKRVYLPNIGMSARSDQQSFIYKKGVVNETKISEPSKRYQHWDVSDPYYEFNEGFHSYIDTNYGSTNALFVIPKGSVFQTGGSNSATPNPRRHDTYLSNKIIYVGRNNWWNRMMAEIKYGVKFHKR